MEQTVLALTPPFTQLNTPYPATAYIKGFLKTKNITCFQADLGIEVILQIFSKNGLKELFESIEKEPTDENLKRIIALKDEYIYSIDAVILFLQGKNPTLALQICQDGFLPEAARFNQIEEDLNWAFGSMGLQDKAKFLATLYLEDLSDLILACVDEHFGFSRYAEKLGRSANSFDELYNTLNEGFSYVDKILFSLLEEKLTSINPKVVLISVPFPGNLYAAFRVGQYLKKYYPNIKVCMGGGFANTELRSLSDARVFEFFDFITLDDGEAPLTCILDHVLKNTSEFKRTFILENEKVVYKNDTKLPDFKQAEVGTPDYSDLLLDKYISVIEIINPMHKMWSDGRWNKLTMAHGCYWGKCTFCDISLDYIKIYEPVAANILCDRIEELIAQTGQNGFHFVDEAAPPALMKAMAIEILRRNLKVTWWTNIRFEKSFDADLCKLLRASGCIAVSGGLEVASDRLLELIDKGVTVAQVAAVTRNFTEAGIMVHAYLMYGFPTQTTQETIDSLEMVRQMFELGIIQSGFWHQFALTAHSPVGMNPEKFKVSLNSTEIGSFANNDLEYKDAVDTDHGAFSYGLKKSLLNYMNGICFELPLQDWFDFKVPKTTISSDYIENVLLNEAYELPKLSTKVLWLGSLPQIENLKKAGFKNLVFHTKTNTFKIKIADNQVNILIEILTMISVKNKKNFTLAELKKYYEANLDGDFELFWYNRPVSILAENGLVYV